MAFVLHQTWDATSSFRTGAGGASAPPALLGPLLAEGRDRYAWKTGATLLSLLVHILILWLFLTRLAGNAGDGAGAGPAVLHSFSLYGTSASSADAPPKAVETVAPPPAPAQQSDVDASTATELAVEWSVSRLPPRPAPPSAPSSAATAGAAPASSVGASVGGGSGGGEVYDPYAGAAPLRREAGQAGASPSLGERVLGFFGLGSQASGGLRLDENALEAIRRAVANALPGRRGTAELTVRVSPTGVVLEASARGGSAPPEARDALGRALLGKRLYQGSAVDAQTLTLPTLRLG